MTLWSKYIGGVLELMKAAFSLDSHLRQIRHQDKGPLCVCVRERETDRLRTWEIAN